MKSETTTQKPSVGRVVHYYDGKEGGLPHAAIIKLVEDQFVSLIQWDPYMAYQSHEKNVEFSKTHRGRCWTWPPRV